MASAKALGIMRRMTNATAFAPGRVEILGNHTDYNGGVVLSAALQLGVTATGCRLANGEIQLGSGDMGDMVTLNRNEGLNPRRDWTDYPLGVAEHFTDDVAMMIDEARAAVKDNCNRR